MWDIVPKRNTNHIHSNNTIPNHLTDCVTNRHSNWFANRIANSIPKQRFPKSVL